MSVTTALAATGPASAADTAPTTAGAITPVANPATTVNPLLGTGDGGAGGAVNAFPGPDVPFGMLQWGPDTSPNRQAGGGYYYNDSAISGFSLTHLSGPGCGAFGDLPILPTVGALPADPSHATAPFSHTAESASADYYAVTTGTGASAVKTELTETARSGIGRFTFPATNQSNLLLKLTGSQNGTSGVTAQLVGDNEIQGSVTSGHFCGASDEYTVNFDIVFDQPFTAHGTWTGKTITPDASQGSFTTSDKALDKPTTPTSAPSPSSTPTLHGDAPRESTAKKEAIQAAAATGPDGLYVTFDSTTTQTLQAKVGISYVSTANAKANLDAEQTGFAFDKVHTTGLAAWNTELNRVQIGGGTPARQQVFYTSLYHALLHPNTFSDTNGQYIGFDNQVHTVQPGHTQVANFSGWDIYHSQVQLEAIIDPAMASNAAQSMVNDAAQNNGMLPKWALNNGETYVMVGDPADAELASYYAFGARDFDTASALKYALAEADTPNNIRPDLATFEKLGYVPTDGPNTCCNFYGPVSTTMEYGAADAALSQFAAALGDTTDATKLMTRAQDWQNLYNPATGILQPRTTSGAFVPATLTTSDNYVEGDASQYRWQIGWNLKGLVSAMGGGPAVAKQLDTFFTKLDEGPPSPYAFMGNEFDYGVPWLYDYTGTPYKAQQVLNRIRTELYTDDPKQSLGGNDDLGTTSALGAFAMLGMFPETPGTADMALNSPEFPLELIHLANGKTITINAPGADSVHNFYVQNLRLNGDDWTKPYLPASAFTHGARIDIRMGSTPNKYWGSNKEDAPPSSTTGAQPAIGYLSDQQIRVTPGGSATVTVSAQDSADQPQHITLNATPPPGLTTNLSTTTLRLSPSGHASATLTINAAATTAQTFYSIPIQLSENGKNLAPVTLRVLVAPPGSLLAAFDNAGIADDTTPSAADFDNDGNSYSAQTLTTAGFTAGAPVTVGDITYTWPLPAPGFPDNAIAAGQQITTTAPPGTRQLGFLGSAGNGPSKGITTLHYSDGTTTQYWLGLSDWTLNGARNKPSFGNQDAATLPYRDCASCTNGKDNTAAHIFATTLPVDPTKTLTAITLPTATDQGTLHIFALGTTTTPPTGPVATTATPSPAAAGQQVTITGTGFGPTQGTGYLAFTDQGTNWGAPGNSAPFTINSWSDTAVTFTVPTPSGTWHVYPGTNASATIVNAAGQVSNSAVLPITPTANPTDYYSNAGTTPDTNQKCADYDGDGYSYSADALAKTGITPGTPLTADGVTFTWPNTQPCTPDNILAAGQTMLVTSTPGATKLGLLGSSTNGDSTGPLTITYTDGTSTTQPLTFNDWASGPSTGNDAVATMPYRNSTSGNSQAITMYVYATTVPLDPTKTVASITFPNIASQVDSNTTAMHIIALGTA
ncbi:MAG: lectin [Catenulispora sp.]|nr:lectin [Catenulispora sp.]